jgi:hypothetical protein
MYLDTKAQLISHVFVLYGSSEQSCICMLCGIAFVSFYDFSIGFGNYFDSVAMNVNLLL